MLVQAAATHLFLSRVVEKGEKSDWRPGQEMRPCLHLNQAKSGRVKRKKKRTFVILVPHIKVWKGPHDATQHLPAPQQDAFHFKDSG